MTALLYECQEDIQCCKYLDIYELMLILNRFLLLCLTEIFRNDNVTIFSTHLYNEIATEYSKYRFNCKRCSNVCATEKFTCSC